MRYKDTGEVHKDFHGATNTTINYIVDKFGEDAMKIIFERVGKNVYKSIRTGLLNNDPLELKEHLQYYFDRENGEYSLEEIENGFIFVVNKCPAIEHIKKLGLKLSPYFCLQTIEVNNALCEGTPWQCKTEITGEGTCRQIFTGRNA